MPDLPARPDLDQLRHQARELLRAARRGNPDATARIRAVSDRLVLSSAQLALAREYGFASWARLKLEVDRRDVLNRRDLSRLTALQHAAVFGMTAVVDVLVAAGARISSLEMAAAVGDVTGWPPRQYGGYLGIPAATGRGG